MNASRGPAIGMAGGAWFHPLDPRPAEVKIEDIAHALANICRFGGRTSRFYSVAQHSMWVARHASTRQAALYGLLHDAAEAYIGDVISPLKQALFFWPEEQLAPTKFETIERGVMWAIYEGLGLAEPTAAITSEVKDLDAKALSVEARELLGDPKWEGLVPCDWPLEAEHPLLAKQQFLDMFEVLR